MKKLLVLVFLSLFVVSLGCSREETVVTDTAEPMFDTDTGVTTSTTTIYTSTDTTATDMTAPTDTTATDTTATDATATDTTATEPPETI